MGLRTAALRGMGSGLALAIITASVSAQAVPRPAVPVEPIAAILDAFRRHDVVALGDAHGTAQAQAFLKALVATRSSAQRSTISSSSSATRAIRSLSIGS